MKIHRTAPVSGTRGAGRTTLLRKLLLLAAICLFLEGIAVPAAQAQLCLDFLNFCDGLELNFEPGRRITGVWRNTTCALGPGDDVPVRGVIRQGLIPDACPLGIGDAGVTGSVGGFDWVFTFDPVLDGTLDMSQGNPPGLCWIDELAYEITFPPCAWNFAPQHGERSLFSTLQ